MSKQRSESFKAEEVSLLILVHLKLRSPRLSVCPTPISIAQTPRCRTGPIGAASVIQNEVSFFLPPSQNDDLNEVGKPHAFDFDLSVIRRLSLSKQVDAIRNFCKSRTKSLSAFQIQLQKVLNTESMIMDLYSIIVKSYDINGEIDNLQYDIRTSINQLSDLEGEYCVCVCSREYAFTHRRRAIRRRKPNWRIARRTLSLP